MKKLRKYIEEYLYMRHQLGFKLVEVAYILNNFATYMEQKKASHIIAKLALAFAQKSACSSFYCAKKLRVIRRFALYLRTIDPLTEVPGIDLLPYSYHRHNPYIFSDSEILKILEACKTFFSNHHLQAETYYTLFGLIAVTGMRTAEALALTNPCVNLTNGIITISESKFRKCRKIPIHVTTIEMLLEYVKKRNKYFGKHSFSYFFVNKTGTRLSSQSVQATFRQICIVIGLRKKFESRGPRIMDFRHTLAIKTLERCYSEGLNSNEIISALSIYLGHENPLHTYWYLTGTPKLFSLINDYLERQIRGK